MYLTIVSVRENSKLISKGFTIDAIYTILFMLILLVGSVLGYSYYLKEKKEELDSIKRGFCPRCHQKSIEITDERGTGCGAPKMVTFICVECGYENVFNIASGSCGI